MTATLALTEDQIISLFEQLEPQHKRTIFYRLAETASKRRNTLMAIAETRLRQQAAEHGLNWDTLSEEEREEFIDDLVHEDR
jgi:TRAP-type C4-dicarboxylate transport system substrate-binding protein